VYPDCQDNEVQISNENSIFEVREGKSNPGHEEVSERERAHADRYTVDREGMIGRRFNRVTKKEDQKQENEIRSTTERVRWKEGNTSR